METLKKRLSEQEKRHQGGSKWIGTAGTSPFGAFGYNPEGIRIGQNESRHKKAIKVWDKREFKDLDNKSELGSRAMKIALKRLRQWARKGINEEIDLESTIHSTAKNGFLDVKTQPEKNKRNNGGPGPPAVQFGISVGSVGVAVYPCPTPALRAIESLPGLVGSIVTKYLPRSSHLHLFEGVCL